MSVSPKGRAERQGVSPRPRRHVRRHASAAHGALRLSGTGQPLLLKSNGGGPPSFYALVKAARHGSRKTPAFRTRWTLRLAACPRRRRLRRRWSRSCRLLPGHALGPSARVAGCHPRTTCRALRSFKQSGVRHRGGHRIPPRVSMTVETRFPSERDGRTITESRFRKKRILEKAVRAPVRGLSMPLQRKQISARTPEK